MRILRCSFYMLVGKGATSSLQLRGIIVLVKRAKCTVIAYDFAAFKLKFGRAAVYFVFTNSYG